MITFFQKFAEKRRAALRALGAALVLAMGGAVTAQQPATPGQLAPLSRFQECDVCPEMIVLPQGAFVMGAPLAQSALLARLWGKDEPGMAHEGPPHVVQMDLALAMGRNEITRSEWMACVEAGGCAHTPKARLLRQDGSYARADHPRHPVFDVSNDDIQQYVRWLNAKVGAPVYRLPTEAEWEYAARAGTDTAFAQGDSLSPTQANIGLFYWQDGRYVPDPDNRSAPVTVDTLPAENAWGLRHMAGNLSERTQSCWSARHLELPSASAYLAVAQQIETCLRVTKGGRYRADAIYARPAHRGKRAQDSRAKHSGFRLVREM